MLLLDKSPIELWRMLLPKKYIVYPKQNSYSEELIFYYRNSVYFVHEDGAIVRMKKPPQLHKFEIDDLWELLFHDHDTFDYDDQGIFTIGGVLREMGFMVPIHGQNGKNHYRVEIIRSSEPDMIADEYDLNHISFEYALYQALVRCDELSKESDGEFEYDIRQIRKYNYLLDKIEPF